MQVMIQSEKITRIRSEILILGFFQDVRPITGYAAEIDWFTGGAISSLIQQNKIYGTLDEATLLATSKVLTPKILLVGLGNKREYDYKILQQISAHALEILTRLKIREAITELWGQEDCSLDVARCLDVFLQGCMGTYSQMPQREAAGDRPVLITLLTNYTDRVKELTHRVREYERAQSVPTALGESGGQMPGLRVLRTETR